MRTPTSFPPIHADERGLIHKDFTNKLIAIFYEVYNELGHGFLESVYEEAFSVALSEHGLFFERQIAVPVWFHDRKIGEFRADILVDRKVIIELKTGCGIDTAWEKQLLNYLRANFGHSAEFKRYAFENSRKGIRVHPRESAEMQL